MFKGSIPALITPFKNGQIDWDAFEKIVEWQIEQGSHGLVPVGTTGESPTLSHEEHRKVIKRCVEITRGRIPIIAGTGSNSTAEAIELTQHAKDDGADAVLTVAPYYNKPTQAGLIAHFTAIHDAVDIPAILYNVPGRSVVDMSIETVAALAKLPHIVGIKDATDDLARLPLTRRETGDEFCQLSGEDGTICAFLAHGGHGIISVLANIAPKQSAQLHEAWWKKDMDTFAKLRDSLMPLADALFCETSPIPVKYAASHLGLCENELRLPLLPATKAAEEKLEAAMKIAGVI